MSNIITTKREVAETIMNLPWGELQEMSKFLAEMIVSAKEEKNPYPLDIAGGMATLLWSWAEAVVEEEAS